MFQSGNLSNCLLSLQCNRHDTAQASSLGMPSIQTLPGIGLMSMTQGCSCLPSFPHILKDPGQTGRRRTESIHLILKKSCRFRGGNLNMCLLSCHCNRSGTFQADSQRTTNIPGSLAV